MGPFTALQGTQIMDMKEKMSELGKIYSAFAENTLEFKKDAACAKGCGFCCKEAGSIDITTLEGLVIRQAMKDFSRSRQKSLTKIFQQEIKKREKTLIVPCPFLMKNNACMIYEVRPFSCRRIYSINVCTQENPPTVNRQVMEAADQSIKELQQLDNTGYSGHLSYILYMLSNPAFMDVYKKGGFKPEEVMEFGKSHKIVINNMMG